MVEYATMPLSFTNKLCKKMGYDEIHSVLTYQQIENIDKKIIILADYYNLTLFELK